MSECLCLGYVIGSGKVYPEMQRPKLFMSLRCLWQKKMSVIPRTVWILQAIHSRLFFNNHSIDRLNQENMKSMTLALVVPKCMHEHHTCSMYTLVQCTIFIFRHVTSFNCWYKLFGILGSNHLFGISLVYYCSVSVTEFSSKCLPL